MMDEAETGTDVPREAEDREGEEGEERGNNVCKEAPVLASLLFLLILPLLLMF